MHSPSAVCIAFFCPADESCLVVTALEEIKHHQRRMQWLTFRFMLFLPTQLASQKTEIVNRQWSDLKKVAIVE